jgi:hypothetical protein
MEYPEDDRSILLDVGSGFEMPDESKGEEEEPKGSFVARSVVHSRKVTKAREEVRC